MRLTIDKERYDVKLGSKHIKLSPKEFDLLVLLVEAKGKVVSRDWIIESMLGKDSDVLFQTRTIDQHVSRLRRKIGRGFVRTVPKRGYSYTEK